MKNRTRTILNFRVRPCPAQGRLRKNANGEGRTETDLDENGICNGQVQLLCGSKFSRIAGILLGIKLSGRQYFLVGSIPSGLNAKTEAILLMST